MPAQTKRMPIISHRRLGPLNQFIQSNSLSTSAEGTGCFPFSWKSLAIAQTESRDRSCNFSPYCDHTWPRQCRTIVGETHTSWMKSISWRRASQVRSDGKLSKVSIANSLSGSDLASTPWVGELISEPAGGSITSWIADANVVWFSEKTAEKRVGPWPRRWYVYNWTSRDIRGGQSNTGMPLVTLRSLACPCRLCQVVDTNDFPRDASGALGSLMVTADL